MSDNKQHTTNKPVIPLNYKEAFTFIKSLENPYNKGIKGNKALLYDNNTAGYGTDIRFNPDIAKRIRNGQWTLQEAKNRAVADMRKHDKVLMDNMKKYTSRPDTISEGPRLLMAQARYHYGNLVKSFPEWAKAIAEGDANKQKNIALKLAEKHPERYKTIKKFTIYK